MSPPLEKLRHHVTGAIERGEKTAIRSLPPGKSTLPPGPWHKGGTVGLRNTIFSASGEPLAKVLLPGDSAMHVTADLITAAPCMLKDLEELVRCFEFNKGSLELDKVAIDNLKATIRKARGEV